MTTTPEPQRGDKRFPFGVTDSTGINWERSAYEDGRTTGFIAGAFFVLLVALPIGVIVGAVLR